MKVITLIIKFNRIKKIISLPSESTLCDTIQEISLAMFRINLVFAVQLKFYSPVFESSFH